MTPTVKELDRKIAKARKAKNAAEESLRELADLKAPGSAKEKKAFERALEQTHADRKKRIQKLREKKQDAKKGGAEKAYEWAVKQIGVSESPAFSNKGPYPISVCQIETIGYDGVPYCGCFVQKAAAEGGVVFPEKARLAYTPYIDYDAGEGRNKLTEVASNNARKGDLAVFHFGSGGAKHVGIVESVSTSTVTCIEGNTSPGTSGSQDNGGGCWRRTRPLSHVICFARPDYPN